jgi:salicylate hydroxylase
MTKKDFNVSVIGGGIGGLTLTIGLVRAGISVDIFEAAPKFAEIGAGISVGNNARNALIKLGLGDDFDELSTQIPSSIWFEWRRGEGDDQKLIATVSFIPFYIQ